MHNTVHIEEKAFMGILLATVEAFPSRFYGERKPKGATTEGEVQGLLFGQRIIRNDDIIVFNVTLAVPNQIVIERTGDTVSVAAVHIDRIKEITELFPTYDFLGFFHSHPYRKSEFHRVSSVEPSDDDMTSSINFADEERRNLLDIIVGITRLERRSWTHPNYPNTNMIHASCGNYKYTLSCNIALANECIDVKPITNHEKRYKSVDNLICTTISGMVSSDFN